MSDDPHGVLGVSRGASRTEITQAYRALAQIYHPDRYAEAPDRVQAEANKRMQAINAAYSLLRRTAADHRPPPAPRTSPRWEPPRQQQPPRAPTDVVFYVDGSKGYHDGEVSPMGWGMVDDILQPVADARRCGKLDTELQRWFEQQRSNASLASRQLYESWDAAEQARFTARVGCTRVPRDKVSSFAMACPECRP